MEKKNMWKRLLSVTLSVCMIVGLITVTEPSKAEASDGTNILANVDFASASSAWVDQDGTPVPAQTLVDDIKVTSEKKYFNDFSGLSPTHGWNINNTTTIVENLDENKVLSFTRGTNNFITYYGTAFETGKTYDISCKVYCNVDTYFRLYNESTGSAIYEDKTAKAGEWTEYSITVTASSNIPQPVTIFKIMDDNTKVYIDDVKIEQITTTTNTETVYTTMHSNDFSSGSTWGWNLQKGTGSLNTIDDGNQVLSWTGKTTASNTYITYHGSSFTAGETYVLSCRIKASGATSVRIYFAGTEDIVSKTVNSDEWTEYSMTITPKVDITSGENESVFYFGIMDTTGNTAYVDDLKVAKATEATAQTYTEGIGTCKNVETDNVLVMKDYTKVTQPVTITSGETYSYSFAVKGVDTGIDFAASVIAGDETVQTITATSKWTIVEGQFTATANKSNFGFARTGEGELWIDDVVLSSSKPTPTDHTSLEGPYIPEGHENLLSGAATDFSSFEHGHRVPSGASVQNGYLKTPIKSDYIQFGGMSTVAGQEYTFSCYIWTEGTDYQLQMYEAGKGSASGSNWQDLTYICKADTDGWVKVEYSFTAKETNSVYIGFQEKWGGDVTLYVDDVALTTAKPRPSDHTVQGGAYIPEGQIPVFSQDMSTSSNLNLNSLANATVEEGMLKLPLATENSYVQTAGINVQVGTKYTLSLYAWVDGAVDGFQFNIFAGGNGISYVNNAITSITQYTGEWKLLTYTFTAKATDTVYFGFINYGTGAGTVYLDDLALSTEAVGEAEEITLTYGDNSDFHIGQEYLLYIQSTGTKEVNLSGTLEIGGTKVDMTYGHHNNGLALNFKDKLSEVNINKIVIPAGTILYDGNVETYKIKETFTIYTQKVPEGQWMTWLSEYDYQGSDILYYDMGTAEAKYVFNNNVTGTYQGVLKVTGKADFVLGGKANSSKEVTALGDYEVSRTMKGEKYDYTVALYKRGDVDKTQDGVLTAKDLVASKFAVSALEDTFGYARYKAADSNTDGAVNEEDAAFMRYILVNDEYDITTTTSKGYSTLGQGVMPIVGYGGPDDHNTATNGDLITRNSLNSTYENDFLTDKIFDLVADLGFNTFINQVHEVGNDYETSTRMLKIAEKYNMGIYINNAYISSPDFKDEIGNQLVAQTAKYDSFSSFHGYYIEDEPDNASAISKYATQLNALKNHANIATYFNMSPLGDSSFSGNTNTYTAYLQVALATGAESLQYDMYLRGKSSLRGYEIKTEEFYKNLDIARGLSINASKPFQAFVQTGANWKDTLLDIVNSKNRLTIQEMYLEANAALAMGAKGINYFTLLESTTQVENNDNYSGLITVSGDANHNEGGNYDYYTAAQKINTFIAAVDEVLMNATSKGVVTTNSTVKGYIGGAAINATDEAAGVLKEVTGSEEAFVGCFDYYGKDAYLIVNITPDEGRGGSSQNITLNFDGTCSYTATDMTCKKTPGSGQSASFTVGAGEAVLVVVE